MKKILFLFIAFTSLTFVSSCSSDDDKGNVSILGKWYHHSYIYEGETELHDHDCSTKNDYIEFGSNNVYKYVYYDTSCDIAEQATFSWTQVGNTITIDSEDIQITELTNTTLKLYDSEYGETFIFKR